MDKLEIKYRTWFKGIPPRPIKLQIPGWAGEPNAHSNGDKPQPWHCPPFVDGATYGLELCYPFESECRVSMVDGKIVFDGDFSEEQKECPVSLPPFLSFAPSHFGMTSSLDIKVPSGYILRTECHPRYYTDDAYTVPCCLPGHIQTEWWPKIFFVVFKNPMPGQTIIFKKGEPYAQVLIIPKKIGYDIKEMTISESMQREEINEKISKHCKKFVKNDWKDNLGQNFDDKYKVLSSVFKKNGEKGIQDLIESVTSKIKTKSKSFIGKLVLKKNESIQDKKKKS
jgi:hypothetical protein